MILASILFPFITVALLLIFFKKKVTTAEWAFLLASTLLLTLIVYLSVKYSSQRDVEYYGGYVKEVRHYDPWNELQTRTRSVPCGSDGKGHVRYCTQVYTVVVYHPDRWTMRTNLSDGERSVSRAFFEKFRKRFGTKGMFVDMHRHYHTIDGDAQSYSWNGKRDTYIPYTEKGSYRNPLKNSYSIFKYGEIAKDSAKALGLYEYPEIVNYNQTPVLGCRVDNKALNQLNIVNGIYGRKCQFRVFVLVFPSSKGIEYSEMQKAYWQGGNKNELVVCIGADSNRHVAWCNPFSWSDEPWLEVETRSWFNEHDTLDLYRYGVWLEKNVPTKWKRKEFSDFEYVHSVIPKKGQLIIMIVTFIFCIGFALFTIFNETERE